MESLRRRFFEKKIKRLKQMISNVKIVDELKKIKEKYKKDLDNSIELFTSFYGVVSDFYTAGKLSDEEYYRRKGE